MKKAISTGAIVILLGISTVIAGTWTTLNAPNAYGTVMMGVSGGKIVGYYADNLGFQHGCTYNGTTWTTLDVPGGWYTSINNIDGTKLVGTHPDGESNKGFVYDGSTWTTISNPLASNYPVTGTYATGISGTNVVGYYGDESIRYHGFLYDGTAWTTLNAPGSHDTYIHGIEGSTIVGCYSAASGTRGFRYSTVTKRWTVLNAPMATGGHTYIFDISGGNIVGSYIDGAGNSQGFLYNGISWTTLSAPGAYWTEIHGIDGNKIVGSYRDASDREHGFLYTIPEPATVVLLGLGGMMLRAKNAKRKA